MLPSPVPNRVDLAIHGVSHHRPPPSQNRPVPAAAPSSGHALLGPSTTASPATPKRRNVRSE
jgi:hypothetical protein